MRITIETIPHGEQRYPTAGDWLFLGDPPTELRIRVSSLDDWRMEALVAVHEVLEAILCQARGISEEAVTEFDELFERARMADPENFWLQGEPGDNPAAPYYREHFFATSIERLLAAELGIDWVVYEADVDKL